MSFRTPRNGAGGWQDGKGPAAGLEEAGKPLKRKPMLGKRGFTRLTGQKAEPVGLKCTLFLSGQEGWKLCSGPGELWEEGGVSRNRGCPAAGRAPRARSSSNCCLKAQFPVLWGLLLGTEQHEKPVWFWKHG